MKTLPPDLLKPNSKYCMYRGIIAVVSDICTMYKTRIALSGQNKESLNDKTWWYIK